MRRTCSRQVRTSGRTGATMPKRNARAFPEDSSVTCFPLHPAQVLSGAPTSATNGADRFRQWQTAGCRYVASTATRATTSCRQRPGGRTPENESRRFTESIPGAPYCFVSAAGPSPTATPAMRPIAALPQSGRAVAAPSTRLRTVPGSLSAMVRDVPWAACLGFGRGQGVGGQDAADAFAAEWGRIGPWDGGEVKPVTSAVTALRQKL